MKWKWKICPCTSHRKGALYAGVFNTFAGMTSVFGLLLVFCMTTPEDLWKTEEEDSIRRQSLGRILMFYCPPAVGAVSVGILIIISTHNNDRLISDAAMIVSTIQAVVSGLEVVAMGLYRAHWVTIVPLMGIFLVQLYMMLVTIDLREYLRNHSRMVKSTLERLRLREDQVHYDASELLRIDPEAVKEEMDNPVANPLSFSKRKSRRVKIKAAEDDDDEAEA